MNEATGDAHYGDISAVTTDLTASSEPTTRTPRPTDGTGADLSREVYLQHGMQPMLETYYDMDHVMNKHIDLREIPELVGHLFDDEKPAHLHRL